MTIAHKYDRIDAAPVILPAAALTPRTGSANLAATTIAAAPCYFFDDTADENVIGWVRLPDSWSYFTVDAIGAKPTTNTGDIRLRIELYAPAASGAGLLSGTIFGNADTTHTTTTQNYRQTCPILTTAVAVPSERIVNVRFHRIGSNAADTLTGDWGLAYLQFTRYS